MGAWPTPAEPRYMPSVLNGSTTLPRASTATRPPRPPRRTSLSCTTQSAASARLRARYSINAATSCAAAILMNASPVPVQDTAQLVSAIAACPDDRLIADAPDRLVGQP